MTNDEINKYIHTEIMGRAEPECNHYWDERQPEWLQKCEYCGFEQPDYCSDASPRSLLDEVECKVIERVGGYAYGFHLWQIATENPSWIPQEELEGRPQLRELSRIYAIVATATAEQRARACVEAHRTTHVDNGRNTQDTLAP